VLLSRRPLGSELSRTPIHSPRVFTRPRKSALHVQTWLCRFFFVIDLDCSWYWNLMTNEKRTQNEHQLLGWHSDVVKSHRVGLVSWSVENSPFKICRNHGFWGFRKSDRTPKSRKNLKIFSRSKIPVVQSCSSRSHKSRVKRNS